MRPPPPPKRATIKQTKAAYKERGRPFISEQEAKQLARAVELDNRAWRSREQEKKRVEAARRRSEKERKARALEQSERVLGGRRCDRFGFPSSQIHLGALFGNGTESGGKHAEEEDGEYGLWDNGFEEEVMVDEAGTSDSFSALQRKSARCMPSPLRHAPGVKHSTVSLQDVGASSNDLRWFEDELESSTQIARDLNKVVPEQSMATTLTSYCSKEDILTASFGSSDFDLSAEDLEALDPSRPAEVKKAETNRGAMPPPPLPAKASNRSASAARNPAKPKFGFSNTRSESLLRSAIAPSTGMHRTDLTASELESFIDDDLQLTQPCPQ